jgi:hypothetical protein
MSTLTSIPFSIALYKGPPAGVQRSIAHHMTQVVMSVRDCEWSPWSHVEMYVDGLCYSSSAMDVMTEGPRTGKVGGMRVKAIDLDSGRWDVYPIPSAPGRTPDECVGRFRARQAVSQGYDWPAGAYWAIPAIHPRPVADNCLEAVAMSVGHPTPSNVTFRGLAEFLGIKV